MNDLVERLRAWHAPGETITGDVQLYLDAADEIERLRNQLAALPDDKRASEDRRRAAIDECIAMAQQWADQAGKSRTYPLQFTSRLFVKALRNLKDAPTPSREPRPAGGGEDQEQGNSK